MSTVAAVNPEQLEGNLTDLMEEAYAKWFRRGVSLARHSTEGTPPVWVQPDRSRTPARWLQNLIACLQGHYGLQPVVLIDEYDSPITHMIGQGLGADVQQSILSVLHSFYAGLKAAQDELHFAFLTGITRFAKVSLFSALNNLNDITWHPDYVALCGFTETEVRDHLIEFIQRIAGEYECPVPELLERLREHYNGYWFAAGENVDPEPVYNPFTLMPCLLSLLEKTWNPDWRGMNCRISGQRQAPPAI